MVIKDVSFVGSFEHEWQCPKVKKPEYAFIGRSNVGKSSLINMLSGRKSIAKVSNTPGKTQTLNYFDINKEWYLVDLPGYGFAKVSKTKKIKWERMIERYLQQRENLVCTFVLLDSRHKLQKIDLEFINSLGQMQVPFVIVYTKTDKLKRAQVPIHIKQLQNGLLEYWDELPQQFVTSSEKGVGREEILSFIEDLNNNY